MIPNFLVPSYKQYKADSDAVATWLANTARRCGYPHDLLSSQTSSSQKRPKLKGRARKLAREAAQKDAASTSKEAPTSSAPPQKYIISIQDFITLAEWIVKSTNPLIEVPTEFVATLNRAITARKRHNDWWYGQDDRAKDKTGLKEANESHLYFIGILQQVRETLCLRMSSEVIKDVAASPNEDEGSEITKTFQALEVVEPSSPEPVLQAEPCELTEQTEKLKPLQFTVQQEPTLEEVYFAVDCFFNDLNNIRRYLQQVWDAYRQGAFDLVAVSLVTNTAIEFVRGIEEDFVQTFPKHTDFAEHINILYIRACLAAGSDPTYKERRDDDMNFSVYEETEKTLFPTYLLLSSFGDIIQPRSVPIYRPGHYGTYNPKSNRDLKSAREKFSEDKIVLLQILPEFCLLASISDVIPAEDEMIRGMRLMLSKKPVTMWLTFAAQVFLDIHHTLRDRIVLGLHDLQKSARFIETSIERALEFHQDLRIDTWPKSNDQVLLQILALIKDWVKLDAVQTARHQVKQYRQVPLPEPFMLLRQHPLWCGLLLFKIKDLAQDAGIAFANAWGSVLCTAHLYNALRQERLLTTAWKDMNLALMLHRTEDMFVGSFPKTTDDYLKRYSLAMGYSATNFASNRRINGRLTASKAGPRSLNSISPVSSMFRPRFCEDENRTNFSPEDVEMVLQKYADDDDINEVYVDETGEWTTPQIKINIKKETDLTEEQKIAIDKLQERQKNKGKRSTNSVATGLRPIELLNALLNELQSETLELTFDHFRLHTFCWRLLQSLQTNLDEDLKRYHGAGYLEKENLLPFVVGYIFMTATNTKQLAGTLKLRQQDVVTNKLLEKAAAVVQTMLETGAGGIVCRLMKDFLDVDVEVPDIMEMAE